MNFNISQSLILVKRVGKYVLPHRPGVATTVPSSVYTFSFRSLDQRLIVNGPPESPWQDPLGSPLELDAQRTLLGIFLSGISRDMAAVILDANIPSLFEKLYLSLQNLKNANTST